MKKRVIEVVSMLFYNIRSSLANVLLTGPKDFGSGEKPTLQAPADGVQKLVSFKGIDTGGFRSYQIIFTENVLDVPAFSKDPGTKVQLWTPNGGTNQLWTFTPFDGGQIAIFNVNSGLVLDAPASAVSPGTALQQWTFNNGGNQRWIIEPDIENLNNFSPGLTAEAAGRNNIGDQMVSLSGDGFEKNTRYNFVFMDLPGPVRNEARLSGLTATSDNLGRFSIPNVDLDFVEGVQLAGDALILAEDEQGFVTCMTIIPRQFFSK